MKKWVLILLGFVAVGCQQNNTSKNIILDSESALYTPYLEKGMAISIGTQNVLGKNLLGKIRNEGTLAAVAFCNEKAYPLTDSMAVVHKATVKRVSDKPRNANNSANSEENGYIALFKKQQNANQAIAPIITTSETTVNFYAPISINAKCLQCHGKPASDIHKNTLAAIKSAYPKDKAVAYNINEIRGMWRISFEK